MAQPYYQPGPNASPQYPNENQPRPQYQQGGRDVGSYPPPRQQMQLAPHDPYGQAPAIGYQAPPTGYPTPPIGDYSRPVQQHVYGEERRGAPVLVPRSQLPQHDRGFGEEMRPPQDPYRTVPSQDQYRTVPSQDQYRTEPSQERYRTVPSQDQYRTVPSQDPYRIQPEYRPPVPRHSPNDVQEERRRREEARRHEMEYGRQEPREYQEPGTMHGIDRHYESPRDHLRSPPSSMHPRGFQGESQPLHPIRYEVRRREMEYDRQEPREYQEPGTIHGMDRRYESIRDHVRSPPSSMHPGGFQKKSQPLHPIRYEPEYTEPSRGMETERVVLDRRLARQDMENQMVESIPRNEPRGFARGVIHLAEDQEQYSRPSSSLARSMTIEEISPPARKDRRRRQYSSDDGQSVFDAPPLNNRPPSSTTRSPSPDYWTMAKENGRGSEQWLRKMIISVLNAHSKVNYDDKNLKMITVEHLSKLIHSYDTGKDVHEGFRFDDVIDESLLFTREITWLNFLREMRDEGLIRIHEVFVSGRREFAFYAPFDKAIASLVNLVAFTD